MWQPVGGGGQEECLGKQLKGILETVRESKEGDKRGKWAENELGKKYRQLKKAHKISNTVIISNGQIGVPERIKFDSSYF